MEPAPIPTDVSPSLIQLHAVRLEAVVALFSARSKEERNALHAQASLLSQLLGLPAPVLPPDRVPVANATLALFWTVVDEGLAAGILHDHSHTADRLAINLPEARNVAIQLGRPLPHGSSLQSALKRCPRVISANHTVNSRIRGDGRKGAAVRCWVFKK
ncbi:TPA: hypothetical protein ACKQCJ_001361 [Stenotrophomonas maltophilia]|uniref:hypothetical protein n=1 Tax=Stenotrophomonas maltophilia TaxID=40324 RepID=UPI0015DFCE18|nr:hypothetical protein [Stenotrophomonas maltophilia]